MYSMNPWEPQAMEHLGDATYTVTIITVDDADAGFAGVVSLSLTSAAGIATTTVQLSNDEDDVFEAG